MQTWQLHVTTQLTANGDKKHEKNWALKMFYETLTRIQFRIQHKTQTIEINKCKNKTKYKLNVVKLSLEKRSFKSWRRLILLLLLLYLFYYSKVFNSYSRILCNRDIIYYLCITIRGGSRVAATSKMERFLVIDNGFQPLTIITKRSILDVSAALDLPLAMSLPEDSRKLDPNFSHPAW